VTLFHELKTLSINGDQVVAMHFEQFEEQTVNLGASEKFT
jgi:hypothetical protein